VPKLSGFQRDSSHYWLALKFIPRLKIAKKLDLVERFGLFELFNSPPPKTESCLTSNQYAALIHPDWERIEGIAILTAKANSHLIGFDDVNYPLLLKQIYDPPLVLFVRGSCEILNHQQLAVVGSRNVSVQGRETAYEFSANLAKDGIVITSGLALGVDAVAHKGAISGGNVTIAVIATGIDKVYPSRHKQLAKDIVQLGGAIVSEFLPGTEPKAGHFPKRNRIISGLSSGVLVIEAAIKSGSLITARCALEQNRDVFALPGYIYNPQVKGCHWLIKQGAKLVDDVADILEEMNSSPINGLNLSRKNNINKDKENEVEKNSTQGLFNDSLLDSVGYEITPVDTVVSRSKLPTDVVLTRLTMLELKGMVSAVPGGYLKLNRG